MKEKLTSIKVLEIEQDSPCEKFVLLKTGMKFFNDIVELFPDCLKTVNEKESPKLGCSWYSKNDRGFMVLYKSNWDQS